MPRTCGRLALTSVKTVRTAHVLQKNPTHESSFGAEQDKQGFPSWIPKPLRVWAGRCLVRAHNGINVSEMCTHASLPSGLGCISF